MQPTVPIAALMTAVSLFAANPPKVLIIYDMEGISGVLSPSFERYGSPDYLSGRQSLTEDVNASIRGLKAGGAGAIWVEDRHGSGNSQEPDILTDKMDPGARFEFRDRPYDPYNTGIDGSVDAIVCIGMHARARTIGFMAHTYTFDVAWKVNGIDLTETHIVAVSAARWGIPVIMVSGDDVLQGQLQSDFPELKYAVVKTAKALSLAESVPRAEADRRIESAARQAMQKFIAGDFRSYYLPGPYDFRLSFRTAEQGGMAAGTRGVSEDGALGVRYASPTFIDGYSIATDAISHAMNAMPILVRILKHEPGGEVILKQLQDLTWQQIDPDKIPTWALPPPSSETKRKYYGDR